MVFPLLYFEVSLAELLLHFLPPSDSLSPASHSWVPRLVELAGICTRASVDLTQFTENNSSPSNNVQLFLLTRGICGGTGTVNLSRVTPLPYAKPSFPTWWEGIFFSSVPLRLFARWLHLLNLHVNVETTILVPKFLEKGW